MENQETYEVATRPEYGVVNFEEYAMTSAGVVRQVSIIQDVMKSIMKQDEHFGIIPGTTICGLSDGAAWPVKNAIKKFRGEFEEYIKSGKSTIKPAEKLVAH